MIKSLPRLNSTSTKCIHHRYAAQIQYNSSAFNSTVPSKRRVVITGMGVVSPVGCNVKTAWTNILDGYCGVSKLSDHQYAKLPCRVAAQISKSELNVENLFSKTELKTMAPATVLALIAANEALDMSNLKSTMSETDRLRTGVAIGMGMIDLVDVCETNKAFVDKGYNRVSPFFVPRILPNMAAGQISIKYGFRGPNHSVSTACATGVHSIGDSFRFIKYNDADIMVCGGAESCISPLAIAGFCRLRALCTSQNDNPIMASRPFDRDRDGFVMGEGSGILILEELNHAKERGIPIIAEILGYGLSGDASHLTAPNEDGLGARLAMERAIHDAGISQKEIQYINAHATSTPIGDAIETKAIKSLFGEHSNGLAVSSTKGAHGHLLGSAGNLEAIFTALACQTGQIPPTINIHNLSEGMDLNYVANKYQVWKQTNKRIALKNSFGFGGTNASICIAQYSD